MYPFYCDLSDSSCNPASFKDLYKMEFDLFSSLPWVLFYSFSVGMFILHASDGWGRMVAMSSYVSRRDKGKAAVIGKGLAWGVGLCYLSFPVYCYLNPMTDVKAYESRQVLAREILELEN